MPNNTQSQSERQTSYRLASGVSTLFYSAVLFALTACGGGSSSPTPSNQISKPETPTASIVVDLTQPKLLSDAELQTSPISNLSPPTTEEKLWLQKNHKKIRSLTYDKDFSDLTFLEQALVGKRIVQLGENSHGTREFSQMKVRMIKYLHEKLGYDVIAFEASTIGCYLQDLAYAKGKTFSVRDSCIFSVWSSKETQELFDYIALTRKTSRPLRLAGFDVQISGSFDRSDVVLPWLMPILRATGDEKLSGAEATISEALSMGESGASCYSNPNGEPCQVFHKNYERIAANVGLLANTFKPYSTTSASTDRESNLMAWMTLSNLQTRLLDTKEQLEKIGFVEPRDKAMAANLYQLATQIYADQKIIVWAHNAHITRGYSGSTLSGETMGKYVAKTMQDQVFTIGLFTLQGETAYNDRSIKKLLPPMNGSLESYSASLQLAALFLPISKTNEDGGGDDWLHRLLNSYWWAGNVVIYDRLDNQFDAVIVIDHSSIPEYVL